ncbi:hypothetical protein LIX87_01355 [Weissella viridescens]|uniref:hypothetical protein n=1 Tax=Weissella viridescens TaxID=1629 RepID=UPI001D068D40|nr:hypothetical protein [Weissella viridescens]MCB6839664.1 hypothetical protein [Weissella viridescens]MCB6846395.1 hypothetical protein [Weissella viridescens]
MDQDKLEVVPQAMMDEMTEVGEEYVPTVLYEVIRGYCGLNETPAISEWYRRQPGIKRRDSQLKLIKHIWLNDPQFKAEKPKKWIVRTIEPDRNGDYWVLVQNDFRIIVLSAHWDWDAYTVKFDTKEEALKYATPQCEVVEVEE